MTTKTLVATPLTDAIENRRDGYNYADLFGLARQLERDLAARDAELTAARADRAALIATLDGLLKSPGLNHYTGMDEVNAARATLARVQS